MTEQNRATFELPAIRGIQQGRQFYSVMVELKDLPRLCVSRDVWAGNGWQGLEMPVQYRRQRELSKVRCTRLFQYLLHAGLNGTPYILPALTCTIDGSIEFIGEGKIGALRVEANQPWFLADGQHRVEAVRRLRGVYHRKEVNRRKLTKTQQSNMEWILGEHVPVTVFHESTDARAQQMFADINRNTSRPPRELLEAFDHRSKPS